MLDPLTALGLASNIIQVIDFTARLLAKGSKTVQRKDQVDQARLKAVTVDLISLSKELQASASSSVYASAEPDQAEKVIFFDMRLCLRFGKSS